MRAPAGRSRRAAVLAGLALTTALTLGPLAAVALLTAPPSAAGTPGSAGAASTLPATVEEDGLPVSVTVDAVTPQVLTPGEDLRLRVTLDNLGDATVVEPRVLVHLDPRSFISRSSLDRWRTASPEGSLGTVVLQVDLEEPLGTGASTSQTVTVPAASLGLSTSPTAWGARGVAVQVVDVDDAARRTQGVARTFALWFPVEEVTATRVSVLVPVVGPAPDQSEEGWTAELDELTAPDGRLTALLEATGEHRYVTWAVDPWLVDAASGALSGTGASDPTPGEEEGTGDPDQDGPTSTTTPEDSESTEAPGSEGTESGDGEPEDSGQGASNSSTAEPDDPEAGDEEGGDVPSTTAEAWAAALVEDTTNRDVQLLPYTDLDLAALAHTQDEDLLDLGVARSQSRAVDGPLPDGAASSLAWPLEEAPDLTTAALVADRGALVVGPGTLPSPAVLTYTPTGRTTVTTANGEATVLVPDERLSTSLRTGGVAMPLPTADPASTEGGVEAGALDVSAPENSDVSALSPAEAAQDLLAELAVITRERPSDARHMLLTVPRDWHPDPAVASAQLEALETAPWVETEPISALIGAPDPGLDRGSLPLDLESGAEVAASELAQVRAALEEREEISTMLEDPEVVLGDPELELLSAASAAWRSDPEGRQASIAGVEAVTATLRSAVSVVPGGDVNLISTTGELPIRVANTLDQAVDVRIGLRPGDSRLRSDDDVEVTIAADSEVTVAIPVHGIQSADVAAAVEVRTPEGVVVDDSTVLTVRVRAEWESIGTAIIGALLAVGVVFGVIRTVRRGRRTGTRAEPRVDSGPDDLSPEEHRA